MRFVVSRLKNLSFWTTALLLPALAAVIFVAVMFFSLRQDLFLSMLGLVTAYLLPPAGKETVIPVGIALGIPWWYMALAITTVDGITGLFMALNFDIVYSIPWAGPRLEKITASTRQFMNSHRWFASLSFLAIILMVMVPFFGSGGIRGSIAGKVPSLGTLTTFLAILAGSLIGCFVIAIGFDAILSWVCSNKLLWGVPGVMCGI